MSPKQSFSKQKTHIFFGSAFLLIVALNAAIGFTPTESFLESIWRGLREIKPIEYLMFAAFWYTITVRRSQDVWHSSLISLNLSNRK